MERRNAMKKRFLTILTTLVFPLALATPSNSATMPATGADWITIPVTGNYWVTGNPDDIEHLGDQHQDDWIDPDPVLTRDWFFNVSIAPKGGANTGVVSLYASNINDGVTDYLRINIDGWTTTLDITMPGDYSGVIDDTQDTFLFQSYDFDSSHLFVGTNTLMIISDGGTSFDYDDFEVTGLTVEYIPEPATVALLGLGSLALIRRRRK